MRTSSLRHTSDRLSGHARRRMQQRAISPVGLALAMGHGMRTEQVGATVFFLGRRHLPKDLPPAVASRIEGTVVVMARDGGILTTFRCREGLGKSRQRLHRWHPKRYALPDGSWDGPVGDH